MRPPLRIGILGCARVAAYALIAPARGVDEVVVSGVASRSAERARQYAEQYRLPRVFPDYEALIADPGIDLVYNALPNSLHREWTIRALRAGKAVLCEKPLAANAGEAAQMAATARETGRALIEAFHFRYHPVADRISEIARSGALGRLRSVEARFLIPRRFVAPGDIRLSAELAGGATMDLGCYCVNAVRLVAGEEPRATRAAATQGPAGIDIAMEAELQFAGGCAGRLACSFDFPEDRWECRLTAVGEHGVLEVENPFMPQAGHSIRLTVDGRSASEALDRQPTYAYQLREVIRVMREGLPIRTPGEDGVATMKVVDDIYRAAGMRPRG